MTTPHTDAAPLGVERTSPDVAAIEARVVEAAVAFARMTRAFAEAHATFVPGQSSPDYGVRLATGEVFHAASLDAVRAESALLAAVDALARVA